ncbi:suppressor of fused domain protein [Actinoplanes utahensis]|uniref:suppressor of fused domain protein n=1 Tax=Actinoplanes utahensis TaxID=1869 RepID=UPI00068F68A1|nr:suppressor of fused domain protein [Actinoplanes utahensis]
MAKLIEHLESYLGTIQGGYSGDERTPEGVGVVSFGPDVPLPGVLTLTTLGLSRHHLSLPDGGHVHQELLMHVTGEDEAYIPSALWAIASRMIERGWALPHGQVITSGPVVPGATVTGLLAINPMFLPSGFAVCEGIEEDTAAVVVWLAPLTAEEIAFAKEHGGEALVEIFTEHETNLSDLRRDGAT